MTRPRLVGIVSPVRAAVPGAELIVLGPSLGTTTALWDAVVGELSADLRVLRFDLPGHGASPATTAPFTLGELADAVIELVDSIGGGTFTYAGISAGGAVGLELALRHPTRLTTLTVLCSAARFGAAAGWHQRAAQARASGTASLVALSVERWFSPSFVSSNPDAVGGALNRLVDVDDESYALCCEALAVFDTTRAVSDIHLPVLCVAGELDRSTPPAQLEELAAAIPEARFALIRGAAHLPAVDRPGEVAALVRSQVGGMRVRRAVLGDAHVDRTVEKITQETADFQSFITRYAWGEIWGRPGLARRERSLLTLAALITGGHHAELALHVRAALTNGLDRAEISEAILHTAIYAGVPAANSAFEVAKQVFAEQDT